MSLAPTVTTPAVRRARRCVFVAILFATALHTLQFFLLPPTAFAKGEELASTAAIDPSPARPFVVSAEFLLLRLPQEGRRVTIVSKIVDGRASALGWGIFLKRYGTSTRLELFWGGGEEGGSYVFERFDFRPRVVYAVSLVSDGTEGVSLYVQELGRLGEQRKTRRQVDLATPSVVKYLGSYPLPSKFSPRNEANVSLGAPRRKSHALPGKVRRLLVATPAEAPARDGAAEQFVSGGPDAIAGRLAANEQLLFWSQPAAQSSAVEP